MNFYPHVDGEIWLRTCKDEISKPIESTSISGTIPRWIDGKLFRNGPGASQVGDLQFGHLFDNFGLIHCFTIKNGTVKYQCRFVNSEYYQKIQSKRLLITDFGTKSTNDPCNTIFHRIKSIFDPSKAGSDNTMITIYPFADEMYAFGESPIIHRINKTTLATEERSDLYKNVGIINHSAHPHIDHDGTIYNIGTSYNKFGQIMHNIVQFPHKNDADEMFRSAKIISSIPSRKFLNPSYMHSFGITQNYFILIQQPLSISIPTFVKNKLLNEPLITSLKWDKRRETRFDVISRANGALVKSFYAPALFFLHVINQFERNERVIIIDVCCYDDPSMIDCMYTEAIKNLQSNPNYAKLFKGRPKRFELQLDGPQRVCGNILCNMGCETPQINYAKCLGRSYRYFYAINSDVDCRYPGRIIKVDVINGHTVTWAEENCYPSEPIFVPSGKNDEGSDEDDGVILASMVWGNGITNRIGLLILNAKTLKEIGHCVFHTPSPVPKCLHGWFLPNQVKNVGVKRSALWFNEPDRKHGKII